MGLDLHLEAENVRSQCRLSPEFHGWRYEGHLRRRCRTEIANCPVGRATYALAPCRRGPIRSPREVALQRESVRTARVGIERDELRVQVRESLRLSRWRHRA